MPSDSAFMPGTLVSARGREWVVQPGSSDATLWLRPLGGSDEDVTLLIPDLEMQPVSPATFPAPDPAAFGSYESYSLFRDATLLKLRSGAGPFRSFGNIAFEPRAYQLVPLLMALKQPTVRLLVADDVGIGKTIEAGLILREMRDRGEIFQAAILCPPHLVEQWQGELWDRFHLRAAALTPANVSRLEKEKPDHLSLFDHFEILVVSLDYIKTERNREHFLAIAPDFLIVDEAHTCAAAGVGKQLRFELLRRLAERDLRHMVFLTATPHSGDSQAFANLLSLLRPDFALLAEAQDSDHKKLREELAAYFVQRRRRDIEEWQDSRVFSQRKTLEITYRLTGAWGAFFDDVMNYTVEQALRAEQQKGEQARLIWYATLALLRCVSSSPASAIKSLHTRLEGQSLECSAAMAEDDAYTGDEHLSDGSESDFTISDIEPGALVDEETAHLKKLIATATALQGPKSDPKLDKLITHVKQLIGEGFHPVIFCRYIATAHYVMEHLAEALPAQVILDAVTGEYPPEERKERVLALGDAEKRVLVATDCLSEGINLQEHFTAVVHYDLAWNPTRHEQREGRVDRFGQRAPEVRATMLYGEDNPVDGFILNVILRKAEEIRKELGITVPLPADEKRINQAVIKSILLRKRQSAPEKARQLSLDFGDSDPAIAELEAQWKDAARLAKANRTIFAQRSLKPADVLPDWQKQLACLGGDHDVLRFLRLSAVRLGVPLTAAENVWRLNPAHFPPVVRERLEQADLADVSAISFHYPPPAQAAFIHRTHPLVTILADVMLEGCLSGAQPGHAARSAAMITSAVKKVTSIVTLRLRHQLHARRITSGEQRLMAEECVTLAVEGRSSPRWLSQEETLPLLTAAPSAQIAPDIAQRQIQATLDFLLTQQPHLEQIAHERAEALLADHQRVRQASKAYGSYQVTACLPVDNLGVAVLLPSDL
ncbi:MAG: DEAD/DEAH box helicase [Verrucomicrobiaceae bacterium]|nr:DEAD/DEAH box helicase [Verrucomicrobiaceae bacterium]